MALLLTKTIDNERFTVAYHRIGNYSWSAEGNGVHITTYAYVDAADREKGSPPVRAGNLTTYVQLVVVPTETETYTETIDGKESAPLEREVDGDPVEIEKTLEPADTILNRLYVLLKMQPAWGKSVDV